jgi:hypothetical protein
MNPVNNYRKHYFPGRFQIFIGDYYNFTLLKKKKKKTEKERKYNFGAGSLTLSSTAH